MSSIALVTRVDITQTPIVSIPSPITIPCKNIDTTIMLLTTSEGITITVNYNSDTNTILVYHFLYWRKMGKATYCNCEPIKLSIEQMVAQLQSLIVDMPEFIRLITREVN